MSRRRPAWCPGRRLCPGRKSGTVSDLRPLWSHQGRFSGSNCNNKCFIAFKSQKFDFTTVASPKVDGERAGARVNTFSSLSSAWLRAACTNTDGWRLHSWTTFFTQGLSKRTFLFNFDSGLSPVQSMPSDPWPMKFGRAASSLDLNPFDPKL